MVLEKGRWSVGDAEEGAGRRGCLERAGAEAVSWEGMGDDSSLFSFLCSAAAPALVSAPAACRQIPGLPRCVFARVFADCLEQDGQVCRLLRAGWAFACGQLLQYSIWGAQWRLWSAPLLCTLWWSAKHLRACKQSPVLPAPVPGEHRMFTPPSQMSNLFVPPPEVPSLCCRSHSVAPFFLGSP